MNKEMIISSSDHDTRVAILEDDQVVEIFIEREHQRGVVGNIYKGRVSKVLPGMQSSFVDIGLERDAFLYVSEVVNTVEEFERLESGDDEDAEPADARLRHAEPAATPVAADGRSGPRGRRRRRTAANAGRRARRPRTRARSPAAEDRGPAEGRARRSSSRSSRSRSAPRARGSPRTSTMPGRFLVFMPTVDHVGVSRKIESREERARLRGIVREFREQHGFTGGVIIRTAAGGRSEGRHRQRPRPTSTRSGPRSARRWRARRPPAVLFQEQSLVTKLLRDLLTDDYTADPHRQRAGASPRDRAGRADHAEPAAAGEALHEGLPDLRGVRRPGGDRQGAAAARCG